MMDGLRKYLAELIILLVLVVVVGVMYLLRPGQGREGVVVAERATSTIAVTTSSASGAGVFLPTKNTNTPTATLTARTVIEPAGTDVPKKATPTRSPTITSTQVVTRTMAPSGDSTALNVPLAQIVSPGGTYMYDEPDGVAGAILPREALVQLYPDDRDMSGVVWSHVATFAGEEGWVARSALEIVSDIFASADDCAAIRGAFPAASVEYFSAIDGQAKVAIFYGISSGETKVVSHDDVVIDLVRLFYLTEIGNLRDDLWVATGVVWPDGTYAPMRAPISSNGRIWDTRESGEQLLASAGTGVRLSLTGFIRPEQSVVWEECSEWDAFHPPGICDIGLTLELKSRSGTAVFLQTGMPPDNWYLFGWEVGLNDINVDVSDAVVCP